MSFKIERTNKNGIDLVILKNTSTGAYASIAPDFGALLHEFTIPTTQGLFNCIDNYENAEDLHRNLATSYKSSKLSPFVCRINDARYLYDGEQMEFPNKFSDGNAIHGLVFDRPFLVTDEFADNNEAKITLKYSYKEDNEGYPFHYRCEVNYTLRHENVLQLETTVINLDDIPIPIADGWHPYFTLGDKTNNYQLYFNSNQLVEFNQKLIPTGQLLPYHSFGQPSLIGNTQLDNCFLLNQSESFAACIVTNPDNGLEISLFPDENYPYLQLYTPPNRESIAIENLSGTPDCFNNKMGLIMLPPRHSKNFSVFYKISQKQP